MRKGRLTKKVVILVVLIAFAGALVASASQPRAPSISSGIRYATPAGGLMIPWFSPGILRVGVIPLMDGDGESNN